MPMILGVDPGRTGALAVIDTVARAIVAMTDVPTLTMSGWRLVDGATVADRWFPLMKHEGRAEAALIALFGASE